MFNYTLKEEAFRIHKETLNRYNDSYSQMGKSCQELYNVRKEAVSLIQFIEQVINSIANTPKEFDTQLGKIGRELTRFQETEEYAKEAYEASLKAGINIVGGVAAGFGVAAMAPTAMMSIATTFGTASTGTAISALSGAAAQKAAVAWVGRNFAGFAVKQGAGMAAGRAFLALAGPIGWGITAASTGISLISMTKKNKELADKAVEEAKEIAKVREAIDETTEKVRVLRAKTDLLFCDMDKQRNKISGYRNAEYSSLSSDEKYFLGSLVNNTLTLSTLLNETVE